MKKKLSNFTPFKDIYINTNHTAIHAMWTIQLILNSYNVDLIECEFILKRQPSVEPKEIREFLLKDTPEQFINYMINVKGKEKKVADIILKTIEIVNKKVMVNISNGYNNLLLIEDPVYLSGYVNKVIDYVKYKLGLDDVKAKNIDRQLHYFYDFVKYQKKENKIRFDSYITGQKEQKDEIESFLDDFDSD